MARIRLTNAETGIYNTEGWSRLTTNNEVVRDNTITPYAGSWSWCLGGDGIAKNSWIAIATTVGEWTIIRGYVRIGGLPAADAPFYVRPSAGASSPVDLVLTTAGTLKLSSSLMLESRVSAALTVGAWHKLEMGFHNFVGDSAANQLVYVIARLDGVEFGRYMQKFVAGVQNRVPMTAAAAGYVPRINLDEFVINDTTGSTDNYWVDNTRPASRVGEGYAKPAVRSVGTLTVKTATSTDTVLPAPPTIVPNDLLVAVIGGGTGTNGFPSLPSGWSLVTRFYQAGVTTQIIAVYIKRASGGEPSSYTFVSDVTNRPALGRIYALSNVGTPPVLDAQACNVPTSSSGYPAPGLDISEGDALIMEFLGWKHATSLATANFASVDQQAMNNKDATTQHGLVGGFYSRDNGGLVRGEMATLDTQSISSVAGVQVAFRGSIAAAPVTRQRFEMVV